MRFKFLNLKPEINHTTNAGEELEIVTSPRRLTTYYAIALLAIGCITLLSHMVQERALENGQGMAATINISGRQRMLSQRIESLAEQYHRGDTTARDEMVKATDEFEKNHVQLSGSYIADTGRGKSYEILHSIYFVGANSLDSEVRSYIKNARAVSTLPPNDPAIPSLLAEMSAEARSPLLTSLNEIVTIHQKDSEERLAGLKALQVLLLLIMGATLISEALIIFRPLVHRIVRLSIRLVHLSTVDHLTEVNNRRGFMERTLVEFQRFQRHHRPMAVIVADIDYFKRVNDTLGHDAGDRVLKGVGAVLKSLMRPTDILGRIGGEEFAMVLPETLLESAVILAERLRRSVADLQIEHNSKTITITSSFGVAAVPPNSQTIDTALGFADKLLYLAKKTGRNCVISENSAEQADARGGKLFPAEIG